MTATGPTNAELIALLTGAFDRPVAALERGPYRYATSHALEEMHVVLDGDDRMTLIFKDFDWERRLPEAAHGKPQFLHEPRREIETYRRVLAETGIGPRCRAAISDERRQWLFLDKVPGIELWQVGRLDVWEAVAAWLAHFHDRFAAGVDAVLERNPHVIPRDGADFERWRDRSCAALSTSDDPRAPGLARRLAAVSPRAAAELPRQTFLHGELYPSNVLVDGDSTTVRIWPIDWEMAAVGAPAFDLAALLTGWDDPVRGRMVDQYRRSLDDPPAVDDLCHEINVCRLHLACQWLGWSAAWQAPPEHAHDWIGEALDAGARLGW